MRRWNGWGDDQINHPLPAAAAARLEAELGPGPIASDASLESTLASMPASRLPDHPLLATNSFDRLSHSRGQSLPDWVALRFGRLPAFVDAVAYPADEADLVDLFALAATRRADLIPYGGGTSVVGHINPRPEAQAVLAVDMRQFGELLGLDQDSGLATFGAGSLGPGIERKLAADGFTLGHFPQSFEYSTLGGWIATRSSGQQSLGYGRIEDLFAGGRLLTPSGALDLPALPASAAGPDLRHLVLGSEGRLGILTQATVRVRPRPEGEIFRAAVLPEWPSGIEVLRQVAAAPGAVSLLRLSDPLETSFSLLLAGRPQLTDLAERALRLLGLGPQRCLLIYGLTGERAAVAADGRRLTSIVRRHGGWPIGPWIGQQWRRSRFRTPYLRNTLWQAGYAVETFETSFTWGRLAAASAALLEALHQTLDPIDERCLALAHVSHAYPDGGCLYVTCLFRHRADPARCLETWRRLKSASMAAIQAYGGAISDHHGVGLDHRPFVEAEKGRLGVAVLEAARQQLDPEGLLNPGKLLPDAVRTQRP